MTEMTFDEMSVAEMAGSRFAHLWTYKVLIINHLYECLFQEIRLPSFSKSLKIWSPYFILFGHRLVITSCLAPKPPSSIYSILDLLISALNSLFSACSELYHDKIIFVLFHHIMSLPLLAF